MKRNLQSNHDYPKFKVQLQLTGLPRKSSFDFQRSNFSEVVSWCCVNVKTAVELLTPVIIEDVCDYLKTNKPSRHLVFCLSGINSP